jgi:leucyl-tRNA---protein transferase
MTWDAPTLPGLRFVRERPCPYLPGRVERTLAAPLPPLRAPEVLDIACRAGFRRSQNYVYRPACRGCAACIPVRVAVDDFYWRRSWRRILGANGDLRSETCASRATPEAFELFHRYQVGRHGAEGMGAMAFSDFRAMVEDSPAPAALIEHRDGSGRLIAALLADHVTDGWSAVYSFAGSPKMSYKARFAPIEVMDSDGWRRVAPPSSTPIIPSNRTKRAG